MNQFAQILNMALQARAGATRVFEILDERPEIVDRPGASDVTHVDGHVEMDHVDFSYVPGVPILRDVSLTALAGQKIGLVGPTGAGKSTIINVITRYYDISAGDIRLDEATIYGLTQSSLRERVGMVLQDPYLFSDTVMGQHPLCPPRCDRRGVHGRGPGGQRPTASSPPGPMGTRPCSPVAVRTSARGSVS